MKAGKINALSIDNHTNNLVSNERIHCSVTTKLTMYNPECLVQNLEKFSKLVLSGVAV